ncbi:MAG: EVE domain-containing protein [Pirellulales bacterium]|nr:EVE domain-containing protein [Pirellulales bacterium]
MPKFWLMKSEPDVYSVKDLAAEKTKTTHWDGVRNYAARNHMRAMAVGDRVLYYHSNCKPAHVAGTAKVVREAYPDFTAWDKSDKHYDAKSPQDNPRWDMVDIKLEQVFDLPVTIDDIKATKSLAKMVLLNNTRLSVQPVTKSEFDTILKLASQLAKKGK